MVDTRSLLPCVGGHWLPDMKELAGGNDDWQLPGDPAVRIDWDQVLDFAAIVSSAKQDGGSMHQS